MLDYIRDGQEIYDQSFATIRSETDLSGIPNDIEKLAVRIIHACGMTDIIENIDFSNHAGTIGKQALQSGAPIFCDSKMVAEGITRKRLPADNDVICTLNHPQTPARAAEIGNTRSAAAVEFWLERLEGSVAVFGNAPTALFHLLELIEEGAPKPAIILGFPVGFIGAEESKLELSTYRLGIPYVTLHGRRGGSAIAAAAVNALASEQE